MVLFSGEGRENTKGRQPQEPHKTKGTLSLLAVYKAAQGVLQKYYLLLYLPLPSILYVLIMCLYQREDILWK